MFYLHQTASEPTGPVEPLDYTSDGVDGRVAVTTQAAEFWTC